MPPRHLRSLPAVLESLANGPGAKRLPAAIEALELRVHAQFNNKRDWAFLRQDLPRIVYANPQLRIDVQYQDEAPSMLVHFRNMPSRTIVFGDKSTNDITRELMTMAQFTE